MKQGIWVALLLLVAVPCFSWDEAPGAPIPAGHGPTHEDGGGDDIDVTNLVGLLADPQTAATHAGSHEDGGGDDIDVTNLVGLLADPQTPATHAGDHQNGGGDEVSVAGLSGLLADPQTPAAHATNPVNTYSIGANDNTTVAIEMDVSTGGQTPRVEFGNHGSVTGGEWLFYGLQAGVDRLMAFLSDNLGASFSGLRLWPNKDLNDVDWGSGTGYYIGQADNAKHIGLEAVPSQLFPYNTGSGLLYSTRLRAGIMFMSQHPMLINRGNTSEAGIDSVSVWAKGRVVLAGDSLSRGFFQVVPGGQGATGDRDPDTGIAGDKVTFQYGEGNTDWTGAEASWLFNSDDSNHDGAIDRYYPNDVIPLWILRGGGYVIRDGPLLVEGNSASLTLNEPLILSAYKENMTNSPGRKHGWWVGEEGLGNIGLDAVEDSVAPYWETTAPLYAASLAETSVEVFTAVSTIVAQLTGRVRMDATSNTVTATLFDCGSTTDGRKVRFVAVDVSNPLTIAAGGGDSILGGAPSLTSVGDSVALICYSANNEWEVH